MHTPSLHKDATLAFDTSVVGASVALLYQGAVSVRHDHAHGQQAAQLVPMIEAVLNEAGIWYDAVSRLVTTVGPGSFTGIRIGLATAQGIIAAAPMAVSILTTLDAIALKAAEIQGDGEIWATLNAGKGEVYSQLFHVKQSQVVANTEISLLSPGAFAAHIQPHQHLFGNARAILPEHVQAQYHTDPLLPDAAVFVRAALEEKSSDALVPLYIRAPDAKLPAKG